MSLFFFYSLNVCFLTKQSFSPFLPPPPSFFIPSPVSFYPAFRSTVPPSCQGLSVCLPVCSLCYALSFKIFYLIFYCPACIYLILLLNFLIIRRSFFFSNSLPYFLPQHSPFLLPFFHLLNLAVIAGPCWSSLVLCFPFPCPLPSLVQVMFPCLL